MQYNGTTSENSSISVGAGGRVTDELHFRANQTNTDVSDQGYWLLVDEGAAVWNEPKVTLDGAILMNSKGLMNSDESRQFGSTYEYAYRISGDITDAEHTARVDSTALSGIDPTHGDSPVIALAPTGAFKSANSNDIKIAAADDSSSATRVYTIQTAQLNIA